MKIHNYSRSFQGIFAFADCRHGTVMVPTWYRHGTVMVPSWYQNVQYGMSCPFFCVPFGNMCNLM